MIEQMTPHQARLKLLDHLEGQDDWVTGVDLIEWMRSEGWTSGWAASDIRACVDAGFIEREGAPNPRDGMRRARFRTVGGSDGH